MQILVWKSKHCDYYYDASTPEALEKSALAIFERLIKDRWIGEPRLYEGWDKELVEVSDEALVGLPASMTEKVHKARAVKAQYERDFEYDKQEWDQLQRLIAGEEVTRTFTLSTGETKTKPVTAWSLLQNRNYEYEDYSVVKVITHE
jgi:hypothetical protein